MRSDLRSALWITRNACLFVEGRTSAKVGSISGLSFLRNADGLFIFLFCVADFLKVWGRVMLLTLHEKIKKNKTKQKKLPENKMGIL
jgi:hypothetical protein